MKKIPRRSLLLAALFISLFPFAQAVDYTNGLMTAVPVKDGKPPVIDAELSDWDLSAQEPVIVSEQMVATMNAEWAFMYDDDALYVSARVAMPDRPYTNPNNPQDAFWSGDILQFRMSADPSLKYPLDRERDAASNRVAHVSFWKNTETGQDFVDLSYGTKINQGKKLNPPGSKVVIKTDGDKGYLVEARIPWSAFNSPDGKNPFKAGEKTANIVETLWIGGDKSRVPMGYRENPGTFGFSSPAKWGQLEFSPKSLGERRRPALEKMLADAGASHKAVAPAIGFPFELDVPDDGLKVSVNILGPKGEVIREVVGAQSVPKGPLTLKWDGRDAWGRPLEPGTYKWGAYFHRGLKAEYAGSVGGSGIPPWQTMDGKGGWGADHSNPIDCAADESGIYFLSPVSEAGKALVKLNYEGNIEWRKNPFVGGGFGPFFAAASDGKTVYLTRGNDKIFLVRLDAATGALKTWGEGGPSEILIYEAKPAGVPPNTTPTAVHDKAHTDESTSLHPNPVGLAVRDGKVYISSFALNKIFVVDAKSGKVTGQLESSGPRGLAIDAGGNLLAASFVSGKSAGVMKFTQGTGAAQPLISRDLEAPFGLAIDPAGMIYVSDLGASQQIKAFDATGKLQKTFGKKGGRPWQGKFDGDAFLNPAGLAVDAKGTLLVSESSPPKVFSRLELPGGKVLHRWYGPGVYWNSTWPMPDDPKHVFYMLTDAIGRAHVAGVDGIGVPDAYWDPQRAGYPQAGNVESRIPQPETVKADNHKLYVVRDVLEHSIFLLENDLMRPVAFWRPVGEREPENTLKRPYLQVWMDANGDGRVQENEVKIFADLPDGSPLPRIASTTSSLHMEPNGDLFFTTADNKIVKVPASGFAKDGTIKWDLAKTSLAVPEVLPGLDKMSTTYREGLLGVRLDDQKNLYTLFNTKLPGKGGAFDFPDAGKASRMLEGMGHTSRFNVIKFAKFDPQGKLLWMAGRKATAGAQPGEMYHFWNMAGLVNDRYIAGGSEWGQIYFYTHDGFFVDALMNNPGDVTPPGPYTFGGETSGGRVQYFPESGDVWAYSTGMTYHVKGFTKGVVDGEKRVTGTVALDKVYELPGDLESAPAGPLIVTPLSGNPLTDEKAWAMAPASVLSRNGAELAQVQTGYDGKFLFGRIRVTDASPMQNGSADLQLAFKGGDTAGIVLGPVREGAKDAGQGDVRLMVAVVEGKPRLIAMKAVSATKKPFEYTTPAAGKSAFDFVDEVPGGEVKVAKTDKGYTVTFAVPLEFLDFQITPGMKLRGDVEVRLSGVGARGLQATSRNYLFTPDRPETTMTDDIAVESRMYPHFWGTVEIK